MYCDSEWRRRKAASPNFSRSIRVGLLALAVSLSACAEQSFAPEEIVTAAATAATSSSIESKHASGMCLGVVNGQAVLTTCSKAAQQQIAVDRNAGRIQVGELCLATKSLTGGQGDRVVTANCNSGATNQKWNIRADEVRGIGDKCLDIYGEQKADGAPVVVWTCHGKSNQKWSVVSRSAPPPPPPAEEPKDKPPAGKTTSSVIESRHAPDMCLAIVDGRAVLESCSKPAAQQVKVDGSRILAGDLCLATQTGSGAQGERLITTNCNSGAANQKWSFTDKDEIRGINNRCIDIYAEAKASGAAIVVWNCHGKTNQKWKVATVSGPEQKPSDPEPEDPKQQDPEEQKDKDPAPGKTQPKDGVAGSIASKQASDMCIGTKDGQALLVSCEQDSARQFEVDDGRIKAGDLCLATSKAAGGSGDRVIVTDCNNAPNQKWTFTSADEIRGIGSLCIDIYTAAKTAGTPIIVWSCHGQWNQKWVMNAGDGNPGDPDPADPEPSDPEPTDPEPEVPGPSNPPVPGSGFFVSPKGSPSGNGSKDRPWDLQTALSHPAAVKPGDTIWVRGGTYTSHYTGRLNGSSNAPIIVRAVPGERATIRSSNSHHPGLTIEGSNAWYWGLEVRGSDTKPPSWGGGPGVLVDGGGSGIKLIHMVTHGNWNSGIHWSPHVKGEAYGVVSWDNGRNAEYVPGHEGRGGYGIYAQSNVGMKITDGIFGPQHGHYPVHVYGQSAALRDIHVVGNIVSDNGGGRWFLIGGFSSAERPVVRRNYMHGVGVNIGYASKTSGHGTIDAVVEDNVFALGDRYLDVHKAKGNFRFQSNRLVGGVSPYYIGEVNPGTKPNNMYMTGKPGSQWVYVRPSVHEEGRAHVAVYNWTRSGSASVDLSGVLEYGESFVVRDAFEPFGPALVQGTYNGRIHVPTGGKEFRAFIVSKY